MATSDGISDSDWESIMSSAEAVADLTGRDLDAGFARRKLIIELEKLEQKYGRLPSILSTRADYIDDSKNKLSLLKEAYATADETLDFKNKVFISSSIIELYLELPEKKALAQHWLEKFKQDLDNYAEDEYFRDLYLEFASKLV